MVDTTDTNRLQSNRLQNIVLRLYYIEYDLLELAIDNVPQAGTNMVDHHVGYWMGIDSAVC